MIDETGQVGQGTGQLSGEGPKQLKPGEEELLQCPYCPRTFKDKRGLGPHLRFHKPKSPKVTKVTKVTGGEANEPAGDVIEQEVNKALENQLTKLIPELKKGIEDNLSTTLVEAIKLLHEKVDIEVSNLAQKVEAELLARFPAAGAGNLQAVQNGMGGMNPILQALLARFMGPSGGSGDGMLEQFSKMGAAVGAFMAPISNMQATAFANALKLIDLAQRFPTATPAEKEKVIAELTGAITGAPPIPPAPPPAAADKTPGVLGPGA